MGSNEDCALNPGDREFPELGAESNAGRHPHATGVSTDKDVGGDSLRGEQQHTNTTRAAERSMGGQLNSPAPGREGEVINTQVGNEHSLVR